MANYKSRASLRWVLFPTDLIIGFSFGSNFVEADYKQNIQLWIIFNFMFDFFKTV